MKKAKEHSIERDDADLLSEASLLSDNDQNLDQGLNLDELYSMLDEPLSNEQQIDPEKLADMEEVVVSDATIDDGSVLDELQAMYSDLNSSGDEDDDVSVMDELEAKYGNSDDSMADDELDTDTTSIMEELESVYGSFSESGNDDIDEGNIDSLMASLDSQSTIESEETTEVSSDSDYEHLFESRTSVLDKLQNLLQSSIDELKAKADSDVDVSALMLDTEYPTRNELINLLETKLSQLRMISDASGSYGSDDASSVIDELNALLAETGSDVSSLDSYSPATSDEVVPAGSALDELESLLTEPVKSTETEALQDASSVSVDADSALKELEAYLGDMSEYPAADVDASVDIDSPVKEEEIDTISTQSDSALGVLEQLEEMMAETATSEKEVSVEEHEAEDVPEPKSKLQPVDMHKIRLEQRSFNKEVYASDEARDSKRLPIASMLLLAAVVIGVIVFWGLFDSGDDQDERIQPDQIELAEEAALSESVPSSDEVASIDDLLASLETTRYEQKSSDDELYTAVAPPYDEKTPDDEEIQPDVESEVVQEVLQDAPLSEQSVQLITSDRLEEPVEQLVIEPFTEDLEGKSGDVWSVHLMSFYKEPPHQDELEFLRIARVPYKIEQVTVKGGIWHRVLVNKTSEYRVAKDYAGILKKSLGIKKIWISKTQAAKD